MMFDNSSTKPAARRRLEIEPNVDECRIVIRVRESLFGGLFLLFFIGLWVYVGITVGNGIFQQEFGFEIEIIVSLFLSIFLIVGVRLFAILLWTMCGETVVTINGLKLAITKTLVWPISQKAYDLNLIKNLRISDNYSKFSEVGRGHTYELKFDFGNKTIRFARGVNETEGNRILNTFNVYLGSQKDE